MEWGMIFWGFVTLFGGLCWRSRSFRLVFLLSTRPALCGLLVQISSV